MIPFQNGTFDHEWDHDQRASRPGGSNRGHMRQDGEGEGESTPYIPAEHLSVFLDETGRVGLFLCIGLESALPVGYLFSERETVLLIEDLRALLNTAREERLLAEEEPPLQTPSGTLLYDELKRHWQSLEQALGPCEAEEPRPLPGQEPLRFDDIVRLRDQLLAEPQRFDELDAYENRQDTAANNSDKEEEAS